MGKQLIKTPFGRHRTKIQLEVLPGTTIADMLRVGNVPATIWNNVKIIINEYVIPRESWDTVELGDSDLVQVFVIPLGGGDDGGKSTLRLIAMIAITVIATVWLGPGGAAGLKGWQAAVAATAFTVVGTLAINALIPPPSVTNAEAAGRENHASYFIQGQQNRANPYGLIPCVYGTLRMAPALAAQPIVNNCGPKSIFSALYDFGLGNVHISDVRAGDTPIERIIVDQPPRIAPLRHVPEYSSGAFQHVTLQYLTHPANYADVSIDLADINDEGFVMTTPDSTEAVVELQFPQGLVKFGDLNEELRTGVLFAISIRKEGDANWQRPKGVTYCAGLPYTVGKGDASPQPPGITFFHPMLESTEIKYSNSGWVWFDTNSDGYFNVTVKDAEGDTEFFLRADAEIEWFHAENSPAGSPVVWAENDPVTQMLLRSKSTVVSGRKYSFQYQLKTKVPVGWIYGRFDRSKTDDINGVQNNAGYTYFGPIWIDNLKPSRPSPGIPGTAPPGGGGGDYDDSNISFWTLVMCFERSSVTLGWWTTSGYLYINGKATYLSGAQCYNYRGDFVKEEDVYASGSYTYRTAYYKVNMAAVPPSLKQLSAPLPAPRATPFVDTNIEVGVQVFSYQARPGVVSVTLPFPEAGRWEIHVRRETPEPTTTDRIINTARWSRLISHGTSYANNPRSILNLQHRHSMMELRLVASEEVEGNISEINAQVASELRYRMRGDNNWHSMITNNPAWVVADLLTGWSIQNRHHMPRALESVGWVKDTQIDWDDFIKLAEQANEFVQYFDVDNNLRFRPRYEFNGVIANDAPIIETAQSILAQCRCRLKLKNSGLIGIAFDEPQLYPVQMFTPANSWGFKGDRTYIEEPDALRVKFTAPDLNYQEGEVVVYRPGQNENSAQLYEDLPTIGITNPDAAGHFGMYMLAQSVFRNETFSLECDIENLVCEVGDKVLIQHDVPLLGSESCYVKEVNGGTITLDRPIGTFNAPIGYTVRRIIDGKILTGAVNQQSGDIIQVNTPHPIGVGELIVIGTKRADGYVTSEYLITGIVPKPDFTATITLVRYDAGVYDPYGDFPVWDPNFGQAPEETTNLETVNLQGSSTLIHINRYPYTHVTLTWAVSPAWAESNVANWQITFHPFDVSPSIDVATIPGGDREYTMDYKTPDNPAVYTPGEFHSGWWSVTPVSTLGYVGKGRQVWVPAQYDVDPPTAVKYFVGIYNTDGTIRFTWKFNAEDNIDYYEILYVALDGKRTFVAKVPWDSNFVSTSWTQEGTYEIIAVDTAGHRSTPSSAHVQMQLPQLRGDFQLGLANNILEVFWSLRAPVDPYIKYLVITYNPDTTLTAPDGTEADVLRFTPESWYGTTFIPYKVGTYFLHSENIQGAESDRLHSSTIWWGNTVSNYTLNQTLEFINQQPYNKLAFTWQFDGLPPELDVFRLYYKPTGGVRRLVYEGPQPTTVLEWFVDSATPDMQAGDFILEAITPWGLPGPAYTKPFVLLSDNSVPGVPGNFAGAQDMSGMLTLSWSIPAGANLDYYDIMYDPSGAAANTANATLLARVNWRNTQYLTTYKLGTYFIRAVNTSGGASAYARAFVTDLTTNLVDATFAGVFGQQLNDTTVSYYMIGATGGGVYRMPAEGLRIKIDIPTNFTGVRTLSVANRQPWSQNFVTVGELRDAGGIILDRRLWGIGGSLVCTVKPGDTIYLDHYPNVPRTAGWDADLVVYYIK